MFTPRSFIRLMVLRTVLLLHTTQSSLSRAPKMGSPVVERHMLATNSHCAASYELSPNDCQSATFSSDKISPSIFTSCSCAGCLPSILMRHHTKDSSSLSKLSNGFCDNSEWSSC